MSLTTGTISRQFGDFSIQLDGSGFPTSGTIRPLSLPTISQDFDTQEDITDISQVYINTSSITLEFMDEIYDPNPSTSTSLIEEIEGLSTTQFITIQVTTPNGTDYFLALKSNCEYDWRRRSVTIQADAALRYETEVTSYTNSGVTITANNQSSDNLTSWSIGANETVMFVKDIINQFLRTQGSSPTTVIVGHNLDYDFGDNFNGASEDEALLRIPPSTYAEAQDIALRWAVAECAFIGSMMGYAYYVRRDFNTDTTVDSQATTVTISASDLTSYGFEFNDRSIRQYLYDLDIYYWENRAGQNGGYALTTTEDVNGSQNVTFDYDIGVNSSDEIYYGLKYDLVSDLRWELVDASITVAGLSGLGSTSRTAYEAIVGIDQSFKVSFEILGIDTLKPFQFITFDTDIHPILNNEKVRPSKLEYDLENNLIRGEGYII